MEEHLYQHAGTILPMLFRSTTRCSTADAANYITCLGAQAVWRLLPEQKTVVRYLTGHTQAVTCLTASFHTIASGSADKVPIAGIFQCCNHAFPRSPTTHKVHSSAQLCISTHNTSKHFCKACACAEFADMSSRWPGGHTRPEFKVHDTNAEAVIEWQSQSTLFVRCRQSEFGIRREAPASTFCSCQVSPLQCICCQTSSLWSSV